MGNNREVVCMKLFIAIGGVIFNNQPHQSDRYVNNYRDWCYCSWMVQWRAYLFVMGVICGVYIICVMYAYPAQLERDKQY